MVPLSVVHTAGLVIALWFIAILVHLLLAFPSGQLNGRADRVLVMAGYLIVLPGNAVPLPFEQTSAIGPPEVHNLLLVHADQALAGVLSTVPGCHWSGCWPRPPWSWCADGTGEAARSGGHCHRC